MKIPLPTERAMGLVTVLSGVAIPVALLIGAGTDLGGDSAGVPIFNAVMWTVNPFGMEAVKLVGGISGGLFKLVASYIVGTGLSALLWGMIDGFFRSRRKSSPSAD